MLCGDALTNNNSSNYNHNHNTNGRSLMAVEKVDVEELCQKMFAEEKVLPLTRQLGITGQVILRTYE